MHMHVLSYSNEAGLGMYRRKGCTIQMVVTTSLEKFGPQPLPTEDPK